MITIDPLRTALVAVHLQNDIVGAQGAFAPFFRAEIDRTGVLDTAARALKTAREAGVKIVYTRVAFRPGHTDLVPNLPLLGMVAQNNCLVDGTPGAALVDEAGATEGDTVVTHTRVTGFHASELDVVLRSAGIDTLAFLGVATNVSVEVTARIASELGYRTMVLSDACSAGSEAAHQASLESLGLLAEVSATDEFLAAVAPSVARIGA
jgi:nicotinamidase-related amidase